MKESRFAYLHLLSWSVSFNGEHFTADANCDDEYLRDIEYELTETQAGRLNKKDGGRSYKPGMKSGRFFSEEHAIRVCSEMMREKWPHIRAIMMDSGCSAQPVRIVWCLDEERMEEANNIWNEIETMYGITNDPWTRFPDKMQACCDDWDKVVALI